ncbi:TPA: hypothetical protein U2N19_003073 [Enterococcus faecium]|uniref:hypothetical protein n=1 Tax=Enterococcus faecium TaxID=1352 RepID=UPI0018C9C52D|nr:hypothetical protein [Enterococcus faecium]MBG7970806.1 hypothetical protein [Enterococcus faecium]MBG7982669.1 hypothetical protein [Enterococcus faecium]MBG8158423.1 hypothetical protein [Enterococcus faecium]MBG8339916.1 hypothetical protein [Enterococcus faecium]
MEEWQSVFEEWFPKEISKSYPIKISKQYTSSQRWEIYAKLTKKQRELVDKHRRYLISSRFMEEHYLAATDWVFSDFKINPFFRTKRSQQKLYCECGRELKVQYIVKSPKTGKILKLGINHFADHLHVSPTVAASIHQGMTKVDLALDELLWLKQKNIDFPEGLWQKYCFVLYQNRRMKQPYLPDIKLAQRLAEFRQVEMPIYIADYQALENEIKKISEHINGQSKKRQIKKELFDDFAEELVKDVEEFLINYRAFLRKDWQSIVYEEVPVHPNAYFETFISVLRKTKRQRTPEVTAQMEYFAKNQRFIQPKIYLFIWKQYCRYGFTEGIPRIVRNGFLKVLRKEREAIQSADKKDRTVSKEKWQLVVKDIQSGNVQETIDKWKGKHYRFTEAQKQALEYYQKLEESLRFNDEARKYLKELL